MKSIPASTISQPISSQHHSEADEIYEKKILVDESSKQLDASIVGTEPTLVLTDPNGETYMADPQDGKSGLSIENPVAGEWTLNAGDISNFTTEIEITGDIPLDYGFSIRKPSSLKETVRKPTKGKTLFAILIIF
jgi:hypothetical protein